MCASSRPRRETSACRAYAGPGRKVPPLPPSQRQQSRAWVTQGPGLLGRQGLRHCPASVCSSWQGRLVSRAASALRSLRLLKSHGGRPTSGSSAPATRQNDSSWSTTTSPTIRLASRPSPSHCRARMCCRSGTVTPAPGPGPGRARRPFCQVHLIHRPTRSFRGLATSPPLRSFDGRSRVHAGSYPALLRG